MNRLKQRGSAVVEATLILPFFIFGMLALYHMAQCRLAEQVVYEAAVETAEYLAEYGYIGDGSTLLPYVKFREHVDDEALVAKYVAGGTDGISFLGTSVSEDHQVCLSVTYRVVCSAPLFSLFSSEHSFCIRQHAYVGSDRNTGEGDDASGEVYVYVTDNREVYHTSRSCTHLLLSIQASTLSGAISEGYTPCEFCGNRGTGNMVYITDEGERYHTDLSCGGLKRTIYRVKKSSVEDLPQCSRCAAAI